ncbi:aminoacyl-histidine dipeptidase [Clostridiaceae bacterium UIB06]|uniref:Cytosol non-specific dipeptidase n=1 Tax=Clostridium thailandense TaxID=2794346 RepID=A0A949WRI4_9CLOT|nr:aminoacyl-histidine dipeptidase [Clostridium thailandense]MBV7274070.1 aminoacyl-histidine dipeptidase [Clostridium thailandense]MCH5137706.1 aminoacyl-histidine dipeptidase [Clostridiaceae bacterium UIB06]
MTNRVLKDLKPVELFRYFEELSQIPRGSGNEKEVSDYLVSFAKEHNLEVIQDEALNVIIKKKATAGYENSPSIAIQGHMDMVCEKEADVEHDFTKEPLKLRIVDDAVYATGTTLGADNGIAVAMGLAILASNEIAHPTIELVCTTSEETGMDGATALDPKNVGSRILINIDSEEEGKFLVSCAGGLTAKTMIPVTTVESEKDFSTYSLKIKGLKGGHSGMEIDKGRANSNKLMGRILKELTSTVEFRMASINGGSKHNAIPREAEVILLTKPENKAEIQKKLAELEETLKTEFRTSDSGIKIEFTEAAAVVNKVFSMQTQNSIINYLYLLLDGVNSMSMDIKGLVESSLNLGVVTTKDNGVEFITSVRSSVRSLKMELYNRIVALAELLGGSVSQEAGYPEWAYNPNSKIRTIFQETFRKIYGKDAEIDAIHAGLECGLFGEKFNGEMDMISFGPNLYDVHTPNEHMIISSVQRSWELLVEALKAVK